MDTELANDRTFLAWLRTGIALFGLGFVVAKVALIVQTDDTTVQNKEIYSAVGAVIVLCGAAIVALGYLLHARVLRSLDRVEATQPRWPITITVVSFVAIARALGSTGRTKLGIHEGPSD